LKTRITAGKWLINVLNAALRDDAEWSETELVALELIEESANRLEVSRRLFDAEAARAEPSRRAVKLAAEVRQLEGQSAKLVASVVPDPDDMPRKSRQHQKAAFTRWHG
jgi:predicted nucleic acid-binding protein